MKKSPSKSIVNTIKFCIIFVFCLYSSDRVLAQHLYGYSDYYLGLAFTNSDNLITNRSRLRLKSSFEPISNESKFYSDFDFRIYHGNRYDSIPVILREFYADLYFKSSDARAGKQIQRWGRTFSSSLSNVMIQLTAEDFITNSQNELYSGFWGISYHHYWENVSLKAVLSPNWSKPQLPQPGNRWFFGIPIDLPIPTRFSFTDSVRNSLSFNGALQLQFKPTQQFDLDLMAFHWFINQPSYFKTFIPDFLNSRFELVETYRQSYGFGASTEWRISEHHRLSADLLFWNSRYVDWLPQKIRDVNVDNPTIPQLISLIQVLQEENSTQLGFLRTRPWLQTVIGYSWDSMGWQFNHEVLLEAIIDYSNNIQQAPFFYSTSHSVIKSFANDFNWISSVIYQAIGHDAYQLSQLNYSYSDAVHLNLSIHLFLGESPPEYYPYLNFAAFKKSNFFAFQLIYFF